VSVGPGVTYLYRRIGKTYIQEEKPVAPHLKIWAEFGRAAAVKDNIFVLGERIASTTQIDRGPLVTAFAKVASALITVNS
jgi:hypothetical protein